jgi:hypothetical protein
MLTNPGRRFLATGLAAALALATPIGLAGQNPDGLGALAPENLAAPRPAPPFDLTGTWLHGPGSERFDPPEGVTLTPAAQAHFDAARQAADEGKIYRNDIGLCWPAGMPIMMTRVWPVSMIQMPTSIFMISELMNSLRIVYLDGRPHTDPDIAVPSFNGESIGHWEDDTLVIHTKTRSIAARCAPTSRSLSCSAIARAPSPVRTLKASASSKPRMAARCSSTRWVSCRPTCR